MHVLTQFVMQVLIGGLMASQVVAARRASAGTAGEGVEASGWDRMRRPLGVLIAAVVVAVVGIGIHQSSEETTVLVELAGLVGGVAAYCALGSVGVIVWRLVR